MGRHTLLTSTAALALLLLGAGTAHAAEVSEVRVGTQDKKHTRIVVELDTAAGYRLSAPQPGQSPELVLTLDASSDVRDVPSKSPLVRKVHVEPSGSGSVVRVQLATADVAVKEMLLANPPRLVFDLSARSPIPEPSAEQAAADAAAEPKEIASAEPAVVPPPAAPVVEVKEEPKPVPPVVAKAEIAPPSAPDAKPVPSEMPSAPKAMEPTPLDIPPPPAATASAPKPAPAPIPVPTPKPIVAKTTPAPAPAKSEGDLFGLLANPIVLAAVAGVVLLGFFLAMRRRRSDEDEDPLYTVMSADDASVVASDVVGDRPPVLSVSPAWDTEAFEASEPALRDGPRQLALGQVPVVQIEAEPQSMTETESFSVPDDSDADSIFAAAEPQPEPYSEPVSAPAYDAEPLAVPVASVAAAPIASAPVPAEMERRFADFERRLEQLTEARERLERQVAAQTEELRVQRAAIARTQRVVRSIAKTEDVATEPVPRAPSA